MANNPNECDRGGQTLKLMTLKDIVKNKNKDPATGPEPNSVAPGGQRY